jgi:uncharacterized membrane protein
MFRATRVMNVGRGSTAERTSTMTTNANTTTQTAAVAEPGAHVAPEKATSTRKATKKQSAPKGRKAAKTNMDLRTQQRNDALAAKKGAKKPARKKATKPAAKKATSTASIPREFSKKQIVLDLLHRKGGATMAEIANATGWQNHYADVRIMPTCAGNPACGAGIAAMESA